MELILVCIELVRWHLEVAMEDAIFKRYQLCKLNESRFHLLNCLTTYTSEIFAFCYISFVKRLRYAHIDPFHLVVEEFPQIEREHRLNEVLLNIGPKIARPSKHSLMFVVQ